MLTLFWTGALLSAYLGYKQHEWWMPAAVAGAALAGQFTLFRWWVAAGGRAPSCSGVADNFVMFFADFGIGRSAGRLKGRWRRGVR